MRLILGVEGLVKHGFADFHARDQPVAGSYRCGFGGATYANIVVN